MEQIDAYLKKQEQKTMRSSYQQSFRGSEKKAPRSKTNRLIVQEAAKQQERRQQDQAERQSVRSKTSQRSQAPQQPVAASRNSLHNEVQEAYAVPAQQTAPAADTLSRAEKESVFSTPSKRHRSKAAEVSLRDMDTSRYLHTDIKTYLEKDAHVTCISSCEGIKKKSKVLQYKYSQNLNTEYGTHFAQATANQRQKQFNLDNARRELKVAFQKPGTFSTSYCRNFAQTFGRDEIGSPDCKVRLSRDEQRGKKPRGELDDDIPKAFAGTSSYALTFINNGPQPLPNKKPAKVFAQGYGKVEKQSSYKQTFAGQGQEKMKETSAAERIHRKEYRDSQVRGNLAPKVALPFKGQSTAQTEFNKKETYQVNKVLPFSLLVVPHGMTMHTKSTAQSEFDKKPLRKRTYQE